MSEAILAGHSVEREELSTVESKTEIVQPPMLSDFIERTSRPMQVVQTEYRNIVEHFNRVWCQVVAQRLRQELQLPKNADISVIFSQDSPDNFIIKIDIAISCFSPDYSLIDIDGKAVTDNILCSQANKEGSQINVIASLVESSRTRYNYQGAIKIPLST